MRRLMSIMMLASTGLTTANASTCDTQLTAHVNQIHEAALRANEPHRAGHLRRVIYLLSNNPLKLSEYRAVLGRYGIEVLPSPRREDSDYVRALLNARAPDVRVLAVLRETSNLFRARTNDVSTLTEHAEPVENRARLDVYTLKGDALDVRHYVHAVAGFVDLTRAAGEDAFGWDDHFVIDTLGLSYGELARRGFKISARDMVLGQYLKDDVHYPARVDMKFHPLSPDGVIDFGKSVADFVARTPLLNLPTLAEHKIDRMLTATANEGVFFRAPINRREKVYWLPGLNAGVPLTPKKDSVHEITFLMHDLGHALIPDLIYTGEDVANGRAIYVAYRMVSEAISLVLADMLYVSALEHGRVEYDFAKRRIYPLYRALGVDLDTPATFVQNLKTLMHATARFCLRGDDADFRRLIGDDAEGLRALDEFARKYTPFFVEDYRWTDRNYANMTARRDEIDRWFRVAAPLAARMDVPLDTIPAAADRLANRPGDLVDLAFDDVFERRVRPIIETAAVALAPEVRRRRAFARYMLGQIGIFARYGFAPGSLAYQSGVLARLTRPDAGTTMASVTEIRGLYDEYVASLERRHLISNDDATTYREVFPLFEPFFVYYDGSPDSYESLPDISRRLLGNPTARRVASARASRSPRGAMRTMIEAGGGEILDDLFVTRPGVSVIAGNPANDALASATVLLSGISADVATEFVAHAREADVARLTTNATRAMDEPYFALPAEDRAAHARVTKALLAVHQAHAPRLTRDHPGAREYANRLHPGSKATVLALTMRITDFDQMLRGRLAPGNEHEVIELGARVAEALGRFFPDVIADVASYRAAGNASKYTVGPTGPAGPRVIGWTIPTLRVASFTSLTDAGRDLLAALRIDPTLVDGERLAEFRARLTYLSFPNSGSDGAAYLRRTVRTHGHRSVLAGSRVVFVASRWGERTLGRLELRLAAHNGRVIAGQPDVRFEADLKELHKIVEGLRLDGETHFARRLTEVLRASFPNGFGG